MNHPALFRFDVYPAQSLRVSSGANEGDAIGDCRDVVAGDTYRLARTAQTVRLALSETSKGTGCVADGSSLAPAGTPVDILASHTLMGARGEVIELLMLAVGAGAQAALYLLPLAQMETGVEYDLVGCDTEDAPRRFADVASVSFLAGTQLTLADGRQVAVEDLSVGDRLLTRDHGAQAVRWIGQQTRRATGAAAPVRIIKGTLNVARDLRLSPQHRLFIWQRHDEVGAGRAEIMVKAEALVDGQNVLREAGGHVDSYQLVFDGHQIIFAEGIAVESLLVTEQIRPLLPNDLMLHPGEDDLTPASSLEIDADDTAPADTLARLSRASRGD